MSFKLAATVGSVVVAATLLTSCSSSVDNNNGPTSVSVVKSSETPQPAGNKTKLNALTERTIPGGSRDWVHLLDVWWLPEVTKVTAGIAATPTVEDASTEGSIHLVVPAAYDVTSQALLDHNTADEFDTFSKVEVEDSTKSGTPDGVVITAVKDNTSYTVTAAADPTSDGFSIVMVKWAPST